MKYILWDWNGTLLDDIDAEVGALNIMLKRRGKNPVTKKFFQDNFAFPSRKFYELVGMDVPDSEWDALAKEYHDTYHTLPYSLNRGAFAALERVRRAGIGQSIISALHQSFLDVEVDRYGVRPYLDYAYGSDNLDGRSKVDRARELMVILGDRAKGRVVMIGDALHDKEVADELGIDCVLCGEGSHSAERLRAVAPTGDTLADAVDIALG